MNRKAVGRLAIAVVALFLVAYFASPLLTVRALIAAAEQGDEATLERLVDFPAFRQSLKDEMNARLIAEMRSDLGGRDSALRGLGMMLAPTLLSGAVDALVTPQAIAAMVRTAETPDAKDVARNRIDSTPEPTAARTEGKRDLRRRYSYRGFNSFAVTLTRRDRPEDRLDLLLERRGVFSWKLAGVDLPDTPAD